MKMFKLLVVLLLLALIAVASFTGYFFYKLYNIKLEQATIQSTASEVDVSTDKFVSSTTLPTDESVTVGEYKLPDTGFVIQVSNLPTNQQSVARSMGFENQIIITPEVVKCAIVRIGSERVKAISNGDAPTTMESVALFGCI